MRFIIFAAVISLLSFMPQKKTRIVFFGDSITQLAVQPGGFILKIDSMAKLDNKSQNYDLIGSGISGNKVYDLYLRMDSDVIMRHPDVVIVYIGVNDVWHKVTAGTGTDANKFEAFYNAMIKKFQQNKIKIILCTPAVIGEKSDNTNQQDGDMNRYANIVRDIAAKNNLPLIDLRKQFMDYSRQNNPDNKESGILTRDRVHLNERGNQLVADLMWGVIKRL